MLFSDDIWYEFLGMRNFLLVIIVLFILFVLYNELMSVYVQSDK